MTSGGARPPEESFADQAFAVAADACARAREDWELGIRAAIAELFEFLGSRPSQTEACVAGDESVGEAALARRDRTIERFTTLLQPGFEAAQAPPPVIAEAIGGGIYELVRAHVLGRRLDELPGAAPDATVVALSPFLGAAGAMEVAGASRR